MRKSSLFVLLPLLTITACAEATSDGLDRDEAVDLVIEELVDESHPLIMFASDEVLPAGTRVSAPSSDPNADDNPEAIVLDEPAWLVWIDDEPGALFGHPNRVVLVAQDDGEIQVLDARWWPMVDDVRVFTDESYHDPESWVHSTGYGEDGFRDAVIPEPAPAAACEGPKRGKALVVNAWQRGETVENDFATNGTQMNMLLESVGLDTTYLGPDGWADTDGYASAETIVPYFMKLETDLKPGEDFVLYITGHGDQAKGEYKKGQTQVGAYWEEDLERWLSRLDPGVNVIVIIDGCHSGGMADGLSCVADLVLSSTDHRTAWADLDTPGWLDSWATDVRDINDGDVGTEWTSSFVAGWNDVVGNEAALDAVESTAQSEGSSFLQELVEKAFDAAHPYDAAEQVGRTKPTITQGAAKTKPSGVTYHTEGLACAPTDPPDPTGCTAPAGAAQAVGQMLGLAPDAPTVTDLVCGNPIDLPTGNEVLYSDGVTTGTAAGAVDFVTFGGVRSIDLPGVRDLACGPSPDRMVLCDGTQPPGAPFLITWFTVDAPLQLQDNEMFTQLAIVFDADGDPANNYVPPEQWVGDYWAGADLAIEIAHSPASGWGMSVLDMANGFTPLDLGVRVVMQGNTVAFAVRMSSFSVPNPGARISAFEHTGDWGQAGPWSADVYPVVGDPLYTFPSQ